MGVLFLILFYLGFGVALTAIATGVLRHLGRRRPSAAVVAVLHLLPLVFTAPGFLPDRTLAPNALLAGVPPWCHPDLVARMEAGASVANPLLADPLAQMQPWRHAARGGWLLDPATHGGAALLANAQSAVLFPVEVVARWLPPPRAATFVQVARLLLAAWGMFLLLRGLALHERGALAGTVVWVGCGFLHFWRLHPHSYVAALAPWILLAMVRLVRCPGPRPAAALALAGALAVFAGHPETLLHTLVLGGLLVLALGRRPRAGQWRGPVRRTVGWSAAAAALSFLLAAPALLPFLRHLPESYEWQARIAAPAAVVELEHPWPEVAQRLVPTLDPFALGDPRQGTWQGPENVAELGGGAVVWTALALLPAALGRSRHRALAWIWLGLGVLGLAVAVGVPGVAAPVEWVPLLRDSLVKRWVLWWALAVSVLVAVAWQRLERGRGVPAALGGAVAVAALLAGVHSVWRGVGAGVPWLPLVSLLLTVMTVACLRWARVAGLRRGAQVLLILLLLVPQAAVLGRWIPVVGAHSFYPVTPAVALVQEALQAQPAGYRVSGLDSALVPHAATYFGLEEVRGYDPMVFAPYAEFLRPLAPPVRDGWSRFSAWEHPILDFLGVRYLFDHPGNYAFHHPGVEQVYAGEDALVFHNPEARPRVFPPEAVRVTGDAIFALEDPARLAVQGEGLPPEGWHRNAPLRVEALSVARGEIAAEVEVLEGAAGAAPVAILATSQPAIPGWQLRVDGRKAEAVIVQGAFLGAALPPEAGRHQVHFHYRPASWRWGLGGGLLGLLLLGGFFLRGQRGNIATSCG